MVSTVGAYLIAAGVLVFLVDLAKNFRVGASNAGNIWNAGTLEWLPSGDYSTRSIPIVTSREPLWDQPNLAADVEAGHYYLPGAPTGTRETIITSPLDARPQYLMQMPGPSWAPLLGALGTAGFFLLLTVKQVLLASAFGVLAVVMVLRWLWQTDTGPVHKPVDIGGGIRLPVYLNGPSSHSWWAMVILIMVSGSIFASLLFAYLFLWTVSPDVWPAADRLPALAWPLASAGLLAASGALVAYAAAVYMLISLQGFFVLIMLFMGIYTIARSLCGLLGPERRVTFENTMLFWYYTVAQGMIALALVHSFPRLVG
ncbi:MAG: hypothetical protein EOO78_27390 [Oxalobacteraceae bacterium]|nr:MAG: hypothetical protein EOO78_27390 [Oxalobacteraceae bacterium]